MGTASSTEVNGEDDEATLARPRELETAPSTDKSKSEEISEPKTSDQKPETQTTADERLNGGTEIEAPKGSWLPVPLTPWNWGQGQSEVQTTSLSEEPPPSKAVLDPSPPVPEPEEAPSLKKDTSETSVGWTFSFMRSTTPDDPECAERKAEADVSTAASTNSPKESPVTPSLVPAAACEDITGIQRSGELEMPEGYLGWWTPCQVELWPGHLLVRRVALPAEPPADPQGETRPEVSADLSAVGDTSKAVQGNGTNEMAIIDKDGDTMEKSKQDDNDIRLRLLLNPSTFEQVSALPDKCFEVVSEQQRYQFRCKADSEAKEWADHIRWAANNVKLCCDEMKWAYVYLNVYDLAQDWRVGLLNRVSQDLLNVGGAFHAGVEVYGKEYTFGCGGDFDDEDDMFAHCYPMETGLSQCDPRKCDRHSFRQTECLGLTTISHPDAIALLLQLAQEWPARSYRLLERNCVTFCRDLSERLGCLPFPDWVDSLSRNAAARTILEPPVLPADDAANRAGDEDGADSGTATVAGPAVLQQEVICFWGHACVLQAQGFIAGFVEYIICESCDRDLARGEAFWHCKLCDFDLCVPCADKRSRLRRSGIDSTSSISQSAIID